MGAREYKDVFLLCPLLRDDLPRSKARSAAADCALRCRFKVDGRCDCKVVQLGPGRYRGKA